ncbi:hypothetical protein [Candidatus Stoquefichus sp. SB1]|jgi:hypothetical protein|uniref:Uncharacterized protein n=1 Tax=Caudovirales sp. ct7oE3 TaxID=2826768 RepID=A0A8S5LZW5_9CAUD|nr:hypothetical protein [Candidatus Stoquefichus sp. SB1]DAD75379.1 MAG TPA: hypothetical protein [Caudovirales sp. ct7oE3]
MENFNFNVITKVEFNNNYIFNISLPNDTNYRNVFLVAVEGNVNVFNVFDVVFVNNSEVKRVLHLADTANYITYSISGQNLVLKSTTLWSYGFCIRAD